MDIILTLAPFSNSKIYEEKIIELNNEIGIDIQLNSKEKTRQPRFNIKATNNDMTFEELVNKFKKLGVYIFESKFYVNDEPSNNSNVHSNYTGFIDFTLEYNLLIIGNGFDIGHGLKTKYTNFLEQIQILNRILNKPQNEDQLNTLNDVFNKLFKTNNTIDSTLDKTFDRLFNIKNFCKNFRQNKGTDPDSFANKYKEKYSSLPDTNIFLLKLSYNVLKNILNEIKKPLINLPKFMEDDTIKLKWFLAKNYISNNLLIQYFLDKYISNTMSGNNWIDIEAEVFAIIKNLETIKINYGNSCFRIHNLTTDPSFKKLLASLYHNDSYFHKEIEEIRKIDNLSIQYNEIKIKKLEQDLDNFIFLLCSYLLSIEEDFTQSKNQQQLMDIYHISHNITHLLSFNYTDTFRKIYSKPISSFYDIDISNKFKYIKNYIYVDFIHGNISNNNLVLGISETLSSEKANTEHSFIYFKKYFQRIYKKTGAKYTDWLKNVTFNTVYIYGHSLDITDKEILYDIITHQNVKKIIIFYYDETHYRQEISNLVKILDKNTFLNYVAEHKIIFKEQSNLYYKSKT